MNSEKKIETKNPAPQPNSSYLEKTGGKQASKSSVIVHKLKSGKMKTNENSPAVKNSTAKKEELKSVTDVNAVNVEAKNDGLEFRAEEIRKETVKKQVMNLDQTIELLNILHVKTVQRDRLLNIISTLEAFEIDLEKDSDGTDNNYYQGCKIIIEDDNRNKFEAKNPFIIQEVAKFINNLCVDKLAEIEASIVIP